MKSIKYNVCRNVTELLLIIITVFFLHGCSTAPRTFINSPNEMSLISMNKGTTGNKNLSFYKLEDDFGTSYNERLLKDAIGNVYFYYEHFGEYVHEIKFEFEKMRVQHDQLLDKYYHEKKRNYRSVPTIPLTLSSSANKIRLIGLDPFFYFTMDYRFRKISYTNCFC